MATTAARGKGAPPSAELLVVPALNDMIDITTTRQMAALPHPPAIVFVLLVGVSILCAVLVGYENHHADNRQWLHISTFVLMSGLTVYTILELEYPRLGLIRFDPFDEVVVDLLKQMT